MYLCRNVLSNVDGKFYRSEFNLQIWQISKMAKLHSVVARMCRYASHIALHRTAPRYTKLYYCDKCYLFFNLTKCIVKIVLIFCITNGYSFVIS